MENIKIKLLRNSKMPLYMTEGAAGADLFACIDEEVILKAKAILTIPTGIKMSIPKGYEIEIRPRSGLAINNGITVIKSPGTIDSDYRGEIKIGLVNHSNQDYIIKSGDRIAQMLLKKVYIADFEQVEELDETIRGSDGFGHTGKE